MFGRDEDIVLCVLVVEVRVKIEYGRIQRLRNSEESIDGLSEKAYA